MDKNTQTERNEEKIRIGDIAEIKKIFLHEMRAKDLIICSSLEYMGDENPFLKPVKTIAGQLSHIKRSLDFTSIYDEEKRDDAYGELNAHIDALRKNPDPDKHISGVCKLEAEIHKKIREKRGFPDRQWLEFSPDRFRKNNSSPMTTEKYADLNKYERYYKKVRIPSFMCACILILRLNKIGQESFNPEYIEMKLEDNLPREHWRTLHTNNEILLSFELGKISLEEQKAFIKEKKVAPYRDKMDLMSKLRRNLESHPSFIHAIFDNSIVQKMDTALDLLRKKSINLKSLADFLIDFGKRHTNLKINENAKNLGYAIEEYDRDFPFLLLSPKEKENYLQEEASAQCQKDLEDQERRKAIETLFNLDSLLKSSFREIGTFEPEGGYYELGAVTTFFNFLIREYTRLVFPDSSAVLNKFLSHEENKAKEAEVRAAEKSRIMGILSHNIRNMLASSILKPVKKLQKKGIHGMDDVFEGIEMIRELIDAVMFSKSGANADFLSDLRNTANKSATMRGILSRALYATVVNMLTDKYSGNAGYEFFPDAKVLDEALENIDGIEWDNIEALATFTQKYFQMEMILECTPSALELAIGNELNTATRFTMLFQELFQNAFKNVAFVQPLKRKIYLILSKNNNDLYVKMTNSYDTSKGSMDTRLGAEIISGFLDNFGAKDRIFQRENNIYTASFALCVEAE